MIANVFFFMLEVFTAFYSNIPGHMVTLQYLFAGLNGSNNLVPFMWIAAILAFLGIILLLIPRVRRNEKALILALISVFIATWLDKGIGLVLGGFVPNAFGLVTEYVPTVTELTIIMGVYAIGLLTLTILYKVVIGVREQTEVGDISPGV